MSFVLVWLASGASALPLSPTEVTGILDYERSDISASRTMPGIVWSCLSTILACIWVAVHPDVPALKPKYTLQTVVRRVAIAACALLVPEYIVVWAVRQWLVANRIVCDLNETKKAVAHEEKQAAEREEEAERRVRVRDSAFVPGQNLNTQYHVSEGMRPAREADEEHDFSREDLGELIKMKGFKLPDMAEINDKSKGDPFSKTFAILQTVWFVLQCVARRLQSLPITELELATLAYTAITVVLYTVWWLKPLNILVPFRVTCDPPLRTPLSSRPPSIRNTGWLAPVKTITYAVAGIQDDDVDLRGEEQVPAFYAGKPDSHIVFLANFITLLITLVFGAVHCIAWSSAFPSHTEQLLWRISSATIVIVPFILIILVGLLTLRSRLLSMVAIVGTMLGVPCYIVARIILLVLPLTTLRSLPLTAYQTVHWLTFLPHV
ncbi:hypothetical protein FIBSPDRAFT_839390 [Athelia psychrophila]|uniref:Uncharacterized protein n=1 Tax=Athelia psychrophila TaxID=1759441 RepID=A0A165YEW4_9AGAM|nr:hypothetical protein FIBSPDRAFT_839390 [Fibularhizoctonia sp. CBS 109695]